MKIVNKPWGYEKWLTDEEGKYFLKEIFMKAGCKSSLQYHRVKEETNYVLNGKGTLTIGDRDVSLAAGDTFHIKPYKVHRVAATENLTMVEASTPEIDDVVRVKDDYNRGNGRIESEHQ